MEEKIEDNELKNMQDKNNVMLLHFANAELISVDEAVDNMEIQEMQLWFIKLLCVRRVH